MPSELLNSWKEIASYLGRGVRTAQRWERQAGLPVRRLNGKSRSAVLAFPADIDAWLHTQAATQTATQPASAQPANGPVPPAPPNGESRAEDVYDELLRNAQTLEAHVAKLKEQLAIALLESKRANGRLAHRAARRSASGRRSDASRSA